MWNLRFLLYVIVLVLAARETSSINDRNYRGGKSNSEKVNNSEGKKTKPQDDSFVKDVEHEALIPDSTIRNGTGELATGTGPPLNNSDTSKGQNSHSNKRHFHRSKIYRKEGRTKQRGNATKRTTNLFPSGTLLGIKSQEIYGNLTSRKRDSAKLTIAELTKRTSRPVSSIRTGDDFILLVNSSLYIASNGSRERFSVNKTKSQDELSPNSSGSTSDDRNNSSFAGSPIEDKSSSVGPTTSLNFEPLSSSTSNQVAAENSASTKSSTRPKLLTESEYRSIDESGSFTIEKNKSDGIYRGLSVEKEKIFGDGVTDGIPASVKPRGNYSVIHRRISAGNFSSIFPASRKANLKDESSSFSPESSDESFDRISLAGVIEALKNVGLSENFLLQFPNSSSNSDSAEIGVAGSSNSSEVEIGSGKRSRSLKDPENIGESPISEDSLPAYSEAIDQPFKLAVPLSFEFFTVNETVDTLRDPLDPRGSLNGTLPIAESRNPDSEIVSPAQFPTKSFPRFDSTRQESAELGTPRELKNNTGNASSSASIEAQSIASPSDGPISVSEIDEPVVRESFRESDETTSDPEGVENFFAEFENCNTSSLSPSFDGYSVETGSKGFRETLNASTTEPESFYIIEGFRFFKNTDEEDLPESEEDLERRETASVDYGETEIYPQIEGFFSALKDIGRIEPETKEEPAVLLRKGNFGVRGGDTSWWSNGEGKEAQKDVREIQTSADYGVQRRIESASSYRILFLNPGFYAIVGVCLIVVIAGFGLWWKRTHPLRRRRTTLPKINRFVKEREETRNAVV